MLRSYLDNGDLLKYKKVVRRKMWIIIRRFLDFLEECYKRSNNSSECEKLS